MEYKYQMHTHTASCSACAKITPSELAQALFMGGYSGCVVTNHFYHGNTSIDRNLSWEQFVCQYESDYLECKKAAKQYDLDIIFGIEEHLYDGLEILCYGITPQFLYDHPELRTDHTIESWSKALHNFGALCIQAHPFRDREYITNPHILPSEYIDGIEAFNYCNKPQENILAKTFALKNSDFILTSGADAHTKDIVCCAGIKTSQRLLDEKVLVNVLKSKKYELIE